MLKTEVLSAINVSDAEYKRIIEKAAETVKRGSVAALPTETVYGLFANALSGEAVRKIFDAKGRPQDNPLIVHIADFEDVYKLSDDVPIEAKL
ncbi:MAG TPA: Sua5/YciO/YrdC/YwlC family protein, partial [Clostridiales bacterium]|nr:Sua5/YciO/YrdC/YwlC family protein [Clostridiales bacterium]